MNSIGLDKPVSETRVVVAMSGGVDSSVTAAMLADEGYDVVGITLQLYDHGEAVERPGSCCAGADIADARRVAETVGIPHYVLDYESKFRQSVIDDFADSYLRGETPIPCVRCNQTVKFRDLLGTAKDLGADALATGHYVRRELGTGGPELHRGIDDGKDQSYFLFATTPEQLDYLRFPLGGLDKGATRDLARKYGLAVSEKPDSQDICFVPNGSYADVVEKLRPGALDPGDIVDLEGNVIGQHDGIINFTVGQRKGMGIAAGEPLYVIRLEPEFHRVVAGPREALVEKALRVADVNWLGPNNLSEKGLDVQVKLRSTQKLVDATVIALTDDSAKVILHDPQAGIAPGQACVFYDGSRVLGGGWIVRD
ncbi:MAG: tRNA 2-thiouridine(34) synthase MnmA [Rhodospirillaceae bacterium]|jgi:tRNA-uridine 2-sulfurtransferase|nr:tRNA 2-thiouridine(34) synthase MnmA [Rhodospirillales bacterium]MBT3907930.1 tRNA 2-thiouridine(34) synthase MnmA [Rhodospirillaceae bacterium]MBT4700780.1 tRNA 2-thiouridine(34) synthase MnmA [Rhodospirillaceae bacterium]MBT5035263.1 tRNA 2-thiouridine(34) synthase MnmA [Rhodospirillaceae bacterium]MBT6218221.1 tRNA 2-thiouridine(34) synthase MnmA [Rhodospirillaceae bacterium]